MDFLRFYTNVSIASQFFTPLIYSLSIIAIIYTSLSCFNAGRHEKINSIFICCTYGLCNFRIFTFTKQGIEGSIYQMISHFDAALFFCRSSL